MQDAPVAEEDGHGRLRAWIIEEQALIRIGFGWLPLAGEVVGIGGL